MRCPNCGLENPEGGIHCGCGYNFPEFRDERECPYCAEKILKKARVCKHCGRDVEPVVEGDTSTQTPSPAPTPATPERITETPSTQPQGSKPIAAAERPPAAAKPPWLRTAPEPPGRMKFFAIAGAALILVVAGVLYYSHHGLKKGKVRVNPNKAANDLRELNTAELDYSSSYNSGYSPSLKSLGRGGCAQPSEKCAGLVDDELASGTKDGYRFTYVPGRPDTAGRVSSYTINADPAVPEDIGSPHWFTDQSGVWTQESGGPAGPNSPDLLGLDRRVPAAQPEQPAEAGNLSPEQGEPIEYSLFYAKAKSTGLPVGKRYRFTADITHDLMLYAQDSHGDKPLAGQAAFDDEAQHERFLQGEDSHRNSDGILTAGTNHTIVASMGYDGRIQIHRIE